MAKRQKLYTALDQIDRDIDQAKRKLAKLKQEAEKWDQEHKRRILEGACDLAAAKDAANQLLDKAARLEHTRLPKLARVRAAFLTNPLFGPRQAVLENK